MEREQNRQSEIDITFIVACYNEEENIIGTLDTLLSALNEVECSWEIIVIDDGSADGSPALVEQYIEDHSELPVSLKINAVNNGLAQNYIDGAFLGKGKYYRLICGDDVESKETLVNLLNHLGEADMIIADQVECAGKALHRRMLSKTYTAIVNFLSGYKISYYNGLAIHLRYNVMRWHTNYRGFGFQADMITRLLDEGVDYLEVETRATERKAGTSTALTVRNLLSVAHFFLDLTIRRIGKILFER